MTTIKMSQIRDLWKQKPLEYVTKPQQTNLLTVTPTLRLSPVVQTTLKKLDAIGFNLATRSQAARLTRLLADPSIQGAILDMSPEEYEQVFTQFVKGTPPPLQSHDLPAAAPTVDDTIKGHLSRISMQLVAQYQHQEMVELVRLLMDTGFMMDDPRWASEVFTELASSNAPSADMAKHMFSLTQNPQAYEQLMLEAASGAQYQNPKVEFNPILDEAMSPSGPVKTKEELVRDNEQIRLEEEMRRKELDLEMQSPTYQQQSRDLQTFLPSKTPPSPAGPAQTGPVAPSAPPLTLPATPIPNYTPGQGGARGKAQALTDFLGQYSQMASNLPKGGVSVPLGDNSGIPILPEDRNKKFKIPSKGGDMVMAYDTMEEAMIVGKTPEGKLIVRTFPNGVADVWDVDGRQVRRSLVQPKRQ